eukprot:gnl/TRDRNA2_/TRDRNA2_37068_c1_seq1.p1 gnl/TRDRNA2_/TRDRNA2_37068_c1~~gnl/TRDRNA2_/TRDRNA2_37068_c1_seq1.p1  ORF type:complete len:482 (+),score=28.10 gnl/TRDRNA2_/TRDRNA2_37068_c1_seq1:1-1446(+)
MITADLVHKASVYDYESESLPGGFFHHNWIEFGMCIIIGLSFVALRLSRKALSNRAIGLLAAVAYIGCIAAYAVVTVRSVLRFETFISAGFERVSACFSLDTSNVTSAECFLAYQGVDLYYQREINYHELMLLSLSFGLIAVMPVARCAVVIGQVIVMIVLIACHGWWQSDGNHMQIMLMASLPRLLLGSACILLVMHNQRYLALIAKEHNSKDSSYDPSCRDPEDSDRGEFRHALKPNPLGRPIMIDAETDVPVFLLESPKPSEESSDLRRPLQCSMSSEPSTPPLTIEPQDRADEIDPDECLASKLMNLPPHDWVVHNTFLEVTSESEVAEAVSQLPWTDERAGVVYASYPASSSWHGEWTVDTADICPDLESGASSCGTASLSTGSGSGSVGSAASLDAVLGPKESGRQVSLRDFLQVPRHPITKRVTSFGSAGHGLGECQAPCEWMQRGRMCKNSWRCPFCHIVEDHGPYRKPRKKR